MIFNTLYLAIALGVLWSLWTVYGVIYRLKLSPIAKFPGPKIAALTGVYEFYYDVVKKGMYIWEIEKMHQKYGPIVRVSPTELHVSDPDFYDEIYAGSSHKRDKYTWYTDATPGVVAGTAPHDFHRARRSVLNPFFSRAGVKNLEPVIQQKVAHLCRRVDDYRRSGQAINVTMALHAFSMDVISSYCFDDCWDHLDYPDFNAAWFHAAETYTKSFKAFAYFKWLHQGLRSIPPRWIGKLVPMIDKFHYYEGRVRSQVDRVLSENVSEKAPFSDEPKSQATVFHDLRDDTTLPPSEKTAQRLTKEGFVFMGAGGAPTSKTLATALYHLIRSPAALSRARAELSTAHPDSTVPLTWSQLEQLPYLTSCVDEALRLHHGITKRSPRCAPNEILLYKDWSIPPGTPVSTQSPFVHYNARLFPDPWAFKPERWIEAGERGEHLRGRLVTFGKGTRTCLGQHLAMCEIHLALAALVREFDFELWGTDDGDVRFERDLFVPSARLGSLGVRAMVVGRRDDGVLASSNGLEVGEKGGAAGDDKFCIDVNDS